MIFDHRRVECPEFIEGKHFTYILQCNDGSYYVGSTDNLLSRLNDHKKAEGAFWTRKRLPVYLIYYEMYGSLSEARRREKQIKGWTREKKEK